MWFDRLSALVCRSSRLAFNPPHFGWRNGSARRWRNQPKRRAANSSTKLWQPSPMGANSLRVHPAFYRRIRHYRDRIGIKDGRPQVAVKFVRAAQELVVHLLQNPRRGHRARFEAPELADILRASVPGFPVFALFYRWDGQTLTVITLEHTAQDLPSRVASIVSTPKQKR